MRTTLQAMAALACVAVLGCGNSGSQSTEAGEEVADPTASAAASELAADRLEMAAVIGALGKAKGAKELKELDARASRLVRSAREASASLPPGADENLADAVAAQREAAMQTAKLASALAELSREANVNREPSDEAQAEVMALSDSATSLLDEVREIELAFRLSARRLELATGELGLEPAEKVSLDTAAIRTSIQAMASDLADRAAALEPVDVVTDCTSEFNTVGDFSTRNMSCQEAQGLIEQAIPLLAESFSVDSYDCAILGEIGEHDGIVLGATDVRCEDGDQAFRFNFAD